jgi:hypothetical protein
VKLFSLSLATARKTRRSLTFWRGIHESISLAHAYFTI